MTTSKGDLALCPVMHMTMAQLRDLAKLNLPDEKSFQVYLAIIEPNIETMIKSYFKDWQDLEIWVTSLVMKDKGIFKTSSVVLALREDEESPLVDVPQFWKIKRWRFSQKLTYLLKESIISQSMYDLLDHLSKRRNRIHEYDGVLTEEDRLLFAAGANLIYMTYVQKTSDNGSMMDPHVEAATKTATALLKYVKENQSSPDGRSVFASSTNVKVSNRKQPPSDASKE